jgi:hypothetical protein
MAEALKSMQPTNIVIVGSLNLDFIVRVARAPRRGETLPGSLSLSKTPSRLVLLVFSELIGNSIHSSD